MSCQSTARGHLRTEKDEAEELEVKRGGGGREKDEEVREGGVEKTTTKPHKNKAQPNQPIAC